ncbi:exosome complex component RRP46 [Strongylocentrotus purpuratus]|uniref:Exosome complex component RRP46 n=1 Tax=Strongylocentrotus purpuratus TaxID=7668 RepID=A0A7M7PSG8_STRPU|nr:exosome complex component RRP46 [Strongylocentrotus purpuratus]
MTSNPENNSSVEIRPIGSLQSCISKPDGSAVFTQGDTSVMAAVYGPGDVKPNKALMDKATVTVTYKPKIGISGVREKALERMIRNTCETVLLTTLFPRSSVDIIVQEIQDAGALLACSINAACLAMINAGIPMKCTVAASCCMMGKDEELIMDPTKEQTKDAECVLTSAIDSSAHSLIASSMQGSCSVEQYHKLMSVCQKACDKVFEFYREAMERTLSKP